MHPNPFEVQTSNFGLVVGETMLDEERVLGGSQWSFCKGRTAPVFLVPAAAAWSWLAFRSSRHLRRPSLNKSVHIFVFWRTQHRLDVNSLVHISAWSCSIFHTSWASSDPLVNRHSFCSASMALRAPGASCCLYSSLFPSLGAALAPRVSFSRQP